MGQPVFLEPHRADVGQRRVQSGSVVPGHPGDDFVHGLTSGLEALPMQAFHLQRPEQRLAAGVVAKPQVSPAVAATAHRRGDSVRGQHVAQVLAGVLAAPVAVQDQPGLLARMALESHHAQRIDDDVARHVLAQAPADHLPAEQVDNRSQ
jgi:hypothetical protein